MWPKIAYSGIETHKIYYALLYIKNGDFVFSKNTSFMCKIYNIVMSTNMYSIHVCGTENIVKI